MDMMQARNGRGTEAFADFVAFWELVTRKKHFLQRDLTARLQKEVAECEAHVAEGKRNILGALTLDPEKRRKIGKAQERLPQAKAELENAQRGLCEALIESIPEVPRIANFECSPTVLTIWTDVLYGYNERADQWFKLGRFRIEFSPLRDDVLDKQFFWHNYDGVYMVENSFVPAPQVDKEGRRFCMGTAKTRIESSLRDGRIDLAIATLIRYTECPHPTHFYGAFPSVSEREVPLWYLETFK